MTENCNSFICFALKLLNADDTLSSPSPKHELRTPKLRLYDPDESAKHSSPIRPFPIEQKITKQKQVDKCLIKCKCMKSRCQKQYCECFAAGKACNIDCNCFGCSNSRCFPQSRRIQTLGCNCKKTGCTKKYCECYQRKQRCTFLCNCIDCCNQDDDSDSDKENVEPTHIGVLGSNLIHNSQIVQQLNK